MRLLRVFPRKTTVTPDDENVRFGMPTFLDEADEIHVDCTFEWDKPLAEFLANQWQKIAPVKIGGVAYGDRGSIFTPGLYLKRGCVITSRGCSNKCWFCQVWRKEGNEIRELPVTQGWNLMDNNILACSPSHQEQVFSMLSRQKERCSLSGGLEAARLTAWHIDWLLKLKPKMMWFAYDIPEDLEHLRIVSKMLHDAGLLPSHKVGCYVLCGWENDSIDAAEIRCIDTAKLGFFPQAMLYDDGLLFNPVLRKKWQKWRRGWVNKSIVGSKMSELQSKP